MHWPHWNLARKRHEQRDEHQYLWLSSHGQLVPVKDIKAAIRCLPEVNKGHQGQQRTQQGIEEKLKGSIDPTWPAPYPDNQIHGDKGGLEEDIKEQPVDGSKHPDHQTREY